MTDIVTIPLDCLLLSDLNVRKTERDADIAALAEDIAERGLKQNLVVTPAHLASGELDEGRFEVVAGGRRCQALMLLAADGRLPGDHPVPCMIELRDEARATSLSENLHRVAMNPADEFEAFAAIAAERAQAGEADSAVRECAKRFGKTVAYVEGRLRLADLAPEILEALRQDKVGVEAAKAYATVGDHKLQRAVFKEREKDSWHGHKPSTIRERLRGKTVGLEDRRVAFVGLDAYLAAGGRTEVEMFMGESAQERLVDVAKLDKLARDKAEAVIPEMARKDGFKEGLYATFGNYDANWPKAPKGFGRAYDYYGDKPGKAKLKKSIAVYSIAQGGTGLERRGRFRPKDEQDGRRGGGYSPPTPEQIAAERRKQGVATIAARLAVGKFAGTPLEGRAFWPTARWLDPVMPQPNDEVLVAVQVRVTRADIEAQLQAAEAKYDEELAAEEAERAQQAAAIAGQTGDELDDVLDEMADGEDEELAAE